MNEFSKRALFLGLFCCFSIFAGVDVKSTLEKIPARDRIVLDEFFQTLMRDHTFAYTLFGNKPVSVADYAKFEDKDYAQLSFERGWEAWQQYAYLFPSPCFVLKKEVTDGIHQIESIWIFNKNNVLKNIDQLMPGVNSDEFVSSFLSSELTWMFCQNNTLLGTLFGYGEENALCFNDESSKYYIQHGSKHRRGFEFPGKEWNLDYFRSPEFVVYGDDTELVKEYEETRRKIRKAFHNRPFLEVTLEQWTNPQ